MSFLRHREIYPSDGGKTQTGQAPSHRLDEFPTGYSLASCSPAEPTSASLADLSSVTMASVRPAICSERRTVDYTTVSRKGADQAPKATKINRDQKAYSEQFN